MLLQVENGTIFNIENALARAMCEYMSDQGHGDAELTPKLINKLAEKFGDPVSTDYIRAGETTNDGKEKAPPHCQSLKVHTSLTADEIVAGLDAKTIGKRGRTAGDGVAPQSREVSVNVDDLLD